MNHDEPAQDPGATIDAMAAAWLVQEEEGFSSEQAAVFVQWQQSDPRHASAVARLQTTMMVLERLPEVGTSGRMPAPPSRRLRWTRAVRFTVFTAVGIAAALAIALIIRRHSATAGLPEADYATTSAGYARVTLEDGSVVELNDSSEVRVRFTPELRQLTLVRGEALFSVAKNPHRPFVVSARQVSVSAVGTAFDVRFQGASVEVLVTEGKVDVSSAAASASGRPGSARVAAGEHLVVAAEGLTAEPAHVEKIEPTATQESLAWQAPHFAFVDTPLSEVVAEFNRRNRIQLEIRDAALGTRLVGGNFRADNVEAFVRLLERNHDIVVERPDDEHIVLRSVPKS